MSENETPTFKQPEQKPTFPEELRYYIPQVEDHIRRYRDLYLSAAGDRSLGFKPGIGTYIDLAEGTIVLGVDQWEEWDKHGLTERTKVFMGLHEVEHFNDIVRPKVGSEQINGEGVLKQFAYMREKARNILPQAVQIIKRNNGGDIPSYLIEPIKSDNGTTTSYLEDYLYQQIHRLYNCLDDMYINLQLTQRATVYMPDVYEGTRIKRKGGFAAREVHDAYRDLLFPTEELGKAPEEGQRPDYTNSALSVQLGDYLLRKRMVPDQEINISDEVRKVLDGFVDSFAQQRGLTLEREVDQITTPGKASRDCQWRYEQLRRTIEPAFINLLFQDLEKLQIPPQNENNKNQGKGDGKKGKGQGMPDLSKPPQDNSSKRNSSKDGSKDESDQEGEANESTENSDQTSEPENSSNPWQGNNKMPSKPFTPEEIEGYIREQKRAVRKKQEDEEARNAEAHLTPEQRAQFAQEQSDKRICEKYEVNRALAEEYRALERSVEPYKRELAEVFELFMKTIEEKISYYWAEGFKNGKFNINSFINKYGSELVSGQLDAIPWDTMPVHDQKEIMAQFMLWPQSIRIDLVIDGSGSMDLGKLLAVKQLYVLIHSATAAFEQTMNMRFNFDKPFAVDVEAYGYGSPTNSAIIKPSSLNKSSDEEMASRFAGLGGIHNDRGSTCSAAPLWHIAHSITDQEEKRNKDGKSIHIVLDCTDGGVSHPAAESDCVICGYRGLHSHSTSAAQDTVDAVGNIEYRGAKVRGLQVGTPGDSERRLFDMVYGVNGEHIPHPADLALAFTRLFSKEILEAEIRLQGVDED